MQQKLCQTKILLWTKSLVATWGDNACKWQEMCATDFMAVQQPSSEKIGLKCDKDQVSQVK